MTDKFADVAPTHLVKLRIQFGETLEGKPNGQWRYQWFCTCGADGKWAATGPKTRAAQAGERARSGGRKHANEWGGKFVP